MSMRPEGLRTMGVAKRGARAGPRDKVRTRRFRYNHAQVQSEAVKGDEACYRSRSRSFPAHIPWIP
jgi:hypothetical protein